MPSSSRMVSVPAVAVYGIARPPMVAVWRVERRSSWIGAVATSLSPSLAARAASARGSPGAAAPVRSPRPGSSGPRCEARARREPWSGSAAAVASSDGTAAAAAAAARSGRVCA